MSDLIERETLKQTMYHEAFEKDSDEQRWDSGCWIRYKMFERVLASIPTVQSERRNGRWEMDEECEAVKCSECGLHYDSWAKGFKYCPNCGAEMEREEGGADMRDEQDWSLPQPEQFNPCAICQEFDCTGCKFRRT